MFAAAVQWAKISDRLKTFPLNARAKSKSSKRKNLRKPRYFALFNRGINGLKNYVVPPRNADFTYWPELATKFEVTDNMGGGGAVNITQKLHEITRIPSLHLQKTL